MVNIKPSASVRCASSCAAYDYCAERDIGMYSGGQFEIGPDAGRSSTSRRCSIPTRRTTSRPAATTTVEPPDGLPASPLAPEPSAIGFRWGEWNDR
jgi:hypothetical protein